jgi:hypothetical protein
MKKMLAFATVVILAVTTGCSQTPKANTADNNSGPQIKFDTLAYDYGTIQQGGNGAHEFVFVNTGNKPLVLSNVRSSCGCTIPEWPKDPIKSGEKSGIKVKYDTRRVGPFSKSITVYSNAKNTPVVLRIKGTVAQTAQNK